MTGATVAELPAPAENVPRRRAPVGRLRSSRDVRAVFVDGGAVAGALAVVHWRDRGDDAPPRATVVAGRKLGGAVQRNRAKRRLRAILATTRLRAGRDYVVVGRAAAVTAPSVTLRMAVVRQLQEAGRR